jgi:cytochrome b6-f complex iron-sulfur subunit
MNRKEFLSLVGNGTASLAIASCFASCAKNVGSGSGSAAPANVDFTLDLGAPANAALLNNGGYMYNNGLIVARTLTGKFIAVQQVCTHESISVTYQASNHRFFCDGHSATFSEAGAVTGGPAPRDLKSYNTSLTGNSLRVYS